MPTSKKKCGSKRAARAKARSKGVAKAKGAATAKNPRCKQCGKTIRVPEGWSVGPAVRRHYWRAHREVMLGEQGTS